MNLLKETEQALEEYGYLWDDILQIRGDDLTVSVDRFKLLADVDVGIEEGAPGVAHDLVILMKDGSWFERERHRPGPAFFWVHRECPDRIATTPDGLVPVVKYECPVCNEAFETERECLDHLRNHDEMVVTLYLDREENGEFKFDMGSARPMPSC